MSLCYVSELKNVGVDQTGHVIPIPDSSGCVDQAPIDFTDGSHHESQAFARNGYIMINTDTALNYVIGPAATTVAAQSKGKRLPADNTIYWKVNAGDVLSVIKAAA